jgi:uncharacterized membrane protein
MSPTHRTISASRARHTLYTLVFASAVCGVLLLTRMIMAHDLQFAGFMWNLILAWIPVGLALYLCRMPGGHRPLQFWTTLVLWVLFFPNAFYIVTDLIHMRKFGTHGIYQWYDLLMTTSFACGGMFLGCLSLYLMHLFIRERLGWRVGWVFASGMLGLGSFGIHLGRKLRLNSWDVVARPFKLVGDLVSLTEPQSAKEATAFSITFFFFSLAVYCFVVSVARLHEKENPENAALEKTPAGPGSASENDVQSLPTPGKSSVST